jgi:hypothetical protein
MATLRWWFVGVRSRVTGLLCAPRPWLGLARLGLTRLVLTPLGGWLVGWLVGRLPRPTCRTVPLRFLPIIVEAGLRVGRKCETPPPHDPTVFVCSHARSAPPPTRFTHPTGLTSLRYRMLI